MVRIRPQPPSSSPRPHGQVVKTPPFHGGIMGSNPVGVTKLELSEHYYYKAVGSGSFLLPENKQISVPSAKKITLRTVAEELFFE